MLKRTNLLIILIIFCSCSALNKKKKRRFSNPKKQLEYLVNNGHFEKAYDLYNSNTASRDWRGIKLIDTSKQCTPILEGCQSEDIKTKQQVLECRYKLLNQCNDRYLTSDLDELENEVKNELIKKEEILSKRSSPILKNSCLNNTKWGYLIFGDKRGFQAFTHNKDYSKLVGKYSSKTECEEQRLLKSETTNVSKMCSARYLGNDKKVNLYKATFMSKTSKRTLYFSNSESCKKAVNKGLLHYIKTGHGYSSLITEFNIQPKDSLNKTRFISNCNLTTPVVCRNGKNGILFNKEILD